MTFSSRYTSHYEASFDLEPVNESLRARIAHKTFQRTTSMSLLKNTYLMRASFAVLGLLVALPFIAPSAFAASVQYVGDTLNVVTEKARVTITRVFDAESDLFSDSDVNQLTEDPLITQVEYVRDENGEMVLLEASCATGEDCTLSLPAFTTDIEADTTVQMEIEAAEQDGVLTTTITKQ